jgi:hypothetical protein
MHADVDGENLFDGPIRHGRSDEDCASHDVVTGHASNERAHFTLRDSMRGVDATLHNQPRFVRRKLFRRVVRLLCPRFIDELDATPVDYDRSFIRHPDRD